MHPETYFLPPTPYVPNSPLPALIYRGVLSNPTPSSVRAAIEANHWLQGGSFKTYTAHHFHSVTHECYAVFKGKTRLRLGKGPLDDENVPNVEVDLFTGDVIILPAGVGHSSISNDSSEGEYEYLGLYPEVRLLASLSFPVQDRCRHELSQCKIATDVLASSCREVRTGIIISARQIRRRRRARTRMRGRCRFRNSIPSMERRDHCVRSGLKQRNETTDYVA